MAYDYSLAVAGVQNAWRHLEQTAHRIAAGSVGAKHTAAPGSSPGPVTGQKPAEGDSVHLKLEEEMLNLTQAEIGVKANHRVLATERELDQDTLDILA
jgi:hypothetical protein